MESSGPNSAKAFGYVIGPVARIILIIVAEDSHGLSGLFRF